MVRRVLASACLCVATAACGPAGAPPPSGTDAASPGIDAAPIPGSLRVEPQNATLTITEGMAASASYQAILTGEDGEDVDVTAEAEFTLVDTRLGSFSGNVLTSTVDRGGQTTVRAVARGELGEARVTVHLETVVIGPGASEDAPDLFGGPNDPTRAPSLVYPASGVLVPPNLTVFEIHFLPGAGNTLFELRFVGTAIDLKIYLGCAPVGLGCVYQLDETVWNLLSEAERGQTAASYTIRGVDGTAPGAVGTSPSRSITFGGDDLVGGLYYWNAGAGAIRRYEFGVSGQTAENFIDATKAGASTCVGCHQLSRDGSRIAVGLDMPSPSIYKVFDVATREMVYQQGSASGGGANFFSFSPDSTEIITSNGVSIAWRSANNGAAILDPVVQNGTMPDWSHDGNRMVFAQPITPVPCFPTFCGAAGVNSASLQVMEFNGIIWVGQHALVPFAGQNNYYPTWSPDGHWVMFNRSPSNTNSFDAADSQVWVVPAEGGNPQRQFAASLGGDSWPKWAPDKHNYHAGQIMWFTFSSRRPYGLRLGAGTAQIWMAAFDPVRAEALGDGSFVAFWLPFQELGSGNHIAQWVTEVERQPCDDNEDCDEGEFCEMGECVPLVP